MGINDRKRKITSIQGNDKKRKSIPEKKKSSSEDSDEHDNEINDVVKSEIPVINRWPQDDVQKLLSQMELALPKIDSITFRSRLTKLDWGKVQFGSYSKDECQSTWLAIQDQLRTFKTLTDLVNDAKSLLATKGIDTYQSKQNRLQKPLSAYMLYYRDILPKYRKKHPDFKLPQLTQIIAEKYKSLSPEKKLTYVDRAQKLRTEYIELVDKTNEGFKPKSLVESSKSKNLVESSKPKSLVESNKPKTPFQIFLESKSNNLSGQFEKAELLNHLKEKWESMSEKKKSKWIKLAKEREQTYLNNLKEDHKNDPAFTMPTKSALTKGDRIILDAQSGKPKKPPVNNYSLFSKEMLQSNELSDVPPKERMTEIAKKWKAFSNEEKQIYSDKLKVITERYITEFEAYLKTLPEDEKQLEMANNKIKPKKVEKVEPKVVPRINAREGIIPEKPQSAQKKKSVSKYNSKTKTFLNEPKTIPYKNAFELYKSKINPNDKDITEIIEDWTNKTDRKKAVYENEMKTLKKQYMKDLKVFLKSLSEDDLKFYLKLRKPELMAANTDLDSKDKSSLEKDNSSSEEDNVDDEDDEDEGEEDEREEDEGEEDEGEDDENDSDSDSDSE